MTQDELQERVVAKIVEDLLQTWTTDDDDGGDYQVASKLRTGLEAGVREAIDAKVNTVCERHIVPMVEQMVDTITIQPTNRYGEPKSEPLTFIEYITKMGREWLLQSVDYQGCAVGDRDYSSGNGKNPTRLQKIVGDKVEKAIGETLTDATKAVKDTFVPMLETVVRDKLAEISTSLNIGIVR